MTEAPPFQRPPFQRPPFQRFTKLLLIFLVLSTATFTMATTAGAEEVRRLEQSYFVGQAIQLELDITIGSMRVEGVEDTRSVSVEMIVTCTAEDIERCRRKAERLRLDPRTSKDGQVLKVRLKNTPRGRLYGLDAEMVVRAPRNMAVEIDLGGGDVFVEKMISHLEVDSGGGDVDVVYPQDRVKKVKIDVGVGNAELWLRDSKIEGSGFPRSIDWIGSGVAEIEVDLVGGDARVRLE